MMHRITVNRVSGNRHRAAQNSIGHLDRVDVSIRHQILLAGRCTHVHIIHVIVVIVVANHIVTVTAHIIAHHNSCRAVETILQIVPHRTEVGQTHPARLDCARAGHSVAFAFLAHLSLYVL